MTIRKAHRVATAFERRQVEETEKRPGNGFVRWNSGNLLSLLPAAMAPIAFSLATMSMAAGFNVGAGMVTAMTLCQVVFAVPLGRAADRVGAVRFLRWVLAIRAVLVFSLMAGIVWGAGPVVVITLAAAGGIANGAITGAFRSMLSDIVAPERMPRAVALSATLNELVFVLGPVLVSVAALPSVVLPIAVMAASSLLSMGMLPRRETATRGRRDRTRADPIPARFVIWLFGAMANSASVAVVEVGAVLLALELHLPATMAALFTVFLCIASVAGGAFTTWRGRTAGWTLLFALVGTTLIGTLVLAVTSYVVAALVGTILIGLCLAPLGTAYSMAAEFTLPVSRRAEGFSWLRTASGVGVVLTSLLLTFTSVAVAAGVAAVIVAIAIATLVLARMSGLAQLGPTQQR